MTRPMRISTPTGMQSKLGNGRQGKAAAKGVKNRMSASIHERYV
jgi:hypothetical protein